MILRYNIEKRPQRDDTSAAIETLSREKTKSPSNLYLTAVGTSATAFADN